MATICGSVPWYSTTCSSDHASAATVQRMTETCRRKASPSTSESSFLRRRLGRRPDDAPLDLGDIATTDVRGRDDATNYCATTARARVDVTSDARNASRAGSRVRASPRGHSRSVKLTRAVPPSIQRRASRSRLTPGAARICRMCAGFGSGEDIGRDVGIFSGSRVGKTDQTPEIDDSFLEFSRLGFCCKSESAALFPIPFSFSFYPALLGRTAGLVCVGA